MVTSPIHTVKFCCEHDVESMTTLYNQCFSKPWQMSDFQVYVTESNVRKCLGVFHGPSLVGLLAYQNVKGEVDIITLCVNPDFRRQGIGSQLIESLKQEKDCISFNLEVNIENTKAIGLYLQHGFTKVGERKDYYLSSQGVAQDAILLQYKNK